MVTRLMDISLGTDIPSDPGHGCSAAARMAAVHTDLKNVSPVAWTARFVDPPLAEKHVRWLLTWRADANERDNLGWTPLTWAVQRNDVGTCKVMLEGLADVNSICRDGFSALSIARQYSHHEVADLLLRAAS